MSTGKAVKKSKEVTDAALTGVKILKGYQDAAAALEKEDQTLSEMQKAVKALTYLGKLNTGLAMLSLGLTVIQIFLPTGKTPQDLILEELAKLSRKLDGIKDDIQELAKTFDLGKAQVLAIGAAADIGRIHGHLLEHGENPSSETLRRLLNEKNESDLDRALSDLLVALEGTAESPNILKSWYEKTHGQVDEVAKHAFFIKYNAELCVQAWVAVRVLQEKTKAEAKGKSWTEANGEAKGREVLGKASSDVSTAGKLRQISEICNKWSKKGFGLAERKKNIKERLDKSFRETAPVHQAYQLTAKRIVDELSAAYSWQKFAVICYDGVTGYSRHAVKAVSRTSVVLPFFRQKDDGGAKMNIVVFATPSRRGQIKKSYTLHDAFNLENSLTSQGAQYNGQIWTVGDKRKMTLGEFADLIGKTVKQNKMLGNPGFDRWREVWPIIRANGGVALPPEQLTKLLIMATSADAATIAKEAGDWRGDFIWMSDVYVTPVDHTSDELGFYSQIYAAAGHSTPSWGNPRNWKVTCLHFCADGF